MNTLENTYAAKVNDEDINLLLKSTTDINKNLEDVLYLLKLNKFPIIDKLLRLVEEKKIRLINNPELAHTTVRWVATDKGEVLVNVTPFVKQKRGLEESYNIPSNELYSLIIGGAVFYYSKELCKDRQFIKDCTEVYLELIAKIFMRSGQGYFKGGNETGMFHYIMLKYFLSKNKTGIYDVDSYAERQSNIDPTDYNVLKDKYSEEDYIDFETLLTNILQNEFPFMKKMNSYALLYTTTQMFGESNAYMIDNIETIGALMTDHVIGNRASLYGRYSSLKGVFKSPMYNNILNVIKTS